MLQVLETFEQKSVRTSSTPLPRDKEPVPRTHYHRYNRTINQTLKRKKITTI